MNKCECCGRDLTPHKTYKLKGYVLCSKHMHQLLKFGKFLDNIQRTNNDLNDYKIENNIAIFNLYNQKNIKVAEFIIDKNDVDKIKYNKWRLSHQHVVTGSGTKNIKDLSWYILNCFDKIQEGCVVDHINNNPLDNRKCNLRVCYQKENVINKAFISTNTSGFIGVSFDRSRNKWCSEIRLNKQRMHFTRRDSLEEAVYQRLIAEEILFKDFVNKQELEKKRKFTKNLPVLTKQKLYNYVKERVHQLH